MQFKYFVAKTKQSTFVISCNFYRSYGDDQMGMTRRSC